MTDAPEKPHSATLTSSAEAGATDADASPPNVASGQAAAAHSVVCERHGLRYNPETHLGCIRCRGALNVPEPRSSGGGPLFFWGLLGAAVLVAGFVFLVPAESGLEDFEGSQTIAPDIPPASGRPGARSSLAARNRAAASAASPLRSGDWPTHEAVGDISIEDRPEPEPFLIDGKPAPDLQSVRYTGRNGQLTVTFEFTQRLEDHAKAMATGIAPAVAFLDIDLSEETGEKGFAGRHGFERAVVGYIGVRYDPVADSYFWAGGMADTPIFDYACSHDVGTVSGYFLDSRYDPGDDDALANTTCSGGTLTARVPYEQLGVTAGQTVRIATEENMGGGKVEQYFLDDVLLTLE